MELPDNNFRYSVFLAGCDLGGPGSIKTIHLSGSRTVCNILTGSDIKHRNYPVHHLPKPSTYGVFYHVPTHAVRPFVLLLGEGGFYFTLLEDFFFFFFFLFFLFFFINLLFLSLRNICRLTKPFQWNYVSFLIEYQCKPYE